jgi:hypothetical protein
MGALLVGFQPISGTIKSQGWLDGKFARMRLTGDWIPRILRTLPAAAIVTNQSFRPDPEPQAIRDDGDGADTAEPKRGKPQQALQQRSRLLPSHQ